MMHWSLDGSSSFKLLTIGGCNDLKQKNYLFILFHVDYLNIMLHDLFLVIFYISSFMIHCIIIVVLLLLFLLS